VAVPQLTITEVRVAGVIDADGDVVGSVVRPLSAIDGAVAVEVVVEADAEPGRIGEGVVVEVGIAPEEISAIGGEAWTWSPAQPSGDTASGATFRGLIQPETVGGFSAAARASTDGGRTWEAALGVGHVDSVASDDIEPPSSPAAPELLDVSRDSVRLRWAASDAPDLHRYLVMRTDDVDGTTGEPQLIGTVDVPVFIDASVTAGSIYRYYVAAQDVSYNISALSQPLTVAADDRTVAVTFSVTIPPTSDPDDVVYIAGGFQGWDPDGTPMTQVDDSTWAISLEFEDAANLEYKYTRGSWEAVEKDAGCGEIPNRTLSVEYAGEGRMEVRDDVEKWRDLDGCG
jgi:hypothetical protein